MTVLGSAGWLLSKPSPAQGRAVLSLSEGELLQRLAEVWFPPSNALGIDIASIDVAGGLDGLLASLGGREQRAIHALLRVLDQFPRASLSSRHTFRALPLEERVALLAAWEESGGPRRQLASLLRLLVGLPIFEDARVLAALGHRFGCPLPLPVPG